MHIKDVIAALKEGKKIRHSSWDREDFIALDKESEYKIYFYRLEAIPFHIYPDTLLSDGWHSIDQSHKCLDFSQALSLLAQGVKINHEDYLADNVNFIEMDLSTKNIYAKKLITEEFTIDHKCLFSTEWMEVK